MFAKASFISHLTQNTIRTARVSNTQLDTSRCHMKHPETSLSLSLLSQELNLLDSLSLLSQNFTKRLEYFPNLSTRCSFAHRRRCYWESLLLGRIVQQTHFEQDPYRRGLYFLNGNETPLYRLDWRFNGQSVPFRPYFLWSLSLPHMRHLAQDLQDTVCFGTGWVWSSQCLNRILWIEQSHSLL